MARVLCGHRAIDTSTAPAHAARGGFVVHEALIEAARRITVPVQFLLPWDDEHVDRRSALALFDAFASKEKTLHANPGDHRTMRWVGVDNGFLARHLGRVDTSPA